MYLSALGGGLQRMWSKSAFWYWWWDGEVCSNGHGGGESILLHCSVCQVKVIVNACGS
jgi:hypothetical protein